MTEFERRVPDWLSAGDAIRRVLSHAEPLDPESVTLPEALGRALAESIQAEATLPPWDNSAMDGYAVRGQDVTGASRTAPIRLDVVGETRAGEGVGPALSPGQAIRIMTGAPIPAGADSVIRVEDTDAESTPGQVRVFSHQDVGRHIRPLGQDMKKGETILTPGTTIGPGQLGLLYATGATRVKVHRRPRVAILSTGDELVSSESFHRVKAGTAIPETNSPTLAAALTLAGAEPIRLGIAGDNPDEIMEAVKRSREEGADALITSGGASMGEKDLLKRVMAEAGMEVDFWRVKIRPGTPFSLGFLPGKGPRSIPVFGLPGNPASSFVTFQIFCRPFILRLAGHQRVHRPVVSAVAGEDLKSPEHLTHFFRVIFQGDPATPRITLTGPQTSGLIRGQGLAQGLAVVPEGVSLISAEEPIRVILLDDMGMGSLEPGYVSA